MRCQITSPYASEGFRDAVVEHVLLPGVAKQAGQTIGLQHIVGEEPVQGAIRRHRRRRDVLDQRIDAVGEQVQLAVLMRIVVVVARAADPVGAVGLAGELEFLRPARVLLDIGVVEIQVDAIRTVLVFEVVGREMPVGGDRGEISERKRMLDAQGHAIEIARFALTDRVVEHGHVERVQIRVRVGRKLRGAGIGGQGHDADRRGAKADRVPRVPTPG